MKPIYKLITSIFLLFTVTLTCGSSIIFELLPEEVVDIVIEYKSGTAEDSHTPCDDLTALEDFHLNNHLFSFDFSEDSSEVSYISNNPFIFDIHLGLSSPPPEQA